MSTPRPDPGLVRAASLAALLALAALLVGCGAESSGDPAPSPAASATPAPSGVAVADGAEVIGTIEATVDGERRTWYVLAASREGRREHTAFWTVLDAASDRPTALIAGYDTRDVPFETFARDTNDASNYGMGTYDGGVVNLQFPFEPGAPDASFQFPGADAAAVYVPDVSADVMAGMFSLDEGELTVTRADAREDGASAFAGRFAGVFMSPAGQTIRFSDGRFEVTGAAYRTRPDAPTR